MVKIILTETISLSPIHFDNNVLSDGQTLSNNRTTYRSLKRACHIWACHMGVSYWVLLSFGNVWINVLTKRTENIHLPINQWVGLHTWLYKKNKYMYIHV